jgi:hypothetical protein
VGGRGRTLTSSVDDLHEAHLVIHHKLLAVGIFYCRIVCLAEYELPGATRRSDERLTSVIHRGASRRCQQAALGAKRSDAHQQNNSK